jgi:hypothetical protein
MGGGWEDRSSPVRLVDGDEFRQKKNDGGTSRHRASGGGGPVDHGEAFRSSYMPGGGRRVAIDSEPFMDREAASHELTPGSLADSLSLVRVLHTEDVEGVLLPGFDGYGRAGWWSSIVLSTRRRVKRSGGGAA